MNDPSENIIPFLRQEQRPFHILTVEDDRIERVFLEQQINDLGHTMISAENGRQALDILQEVKDYIDIILMDRTMPVMDGITAIHHIKNDPALRKIPIIMVTGAATDKEMQEGIDAGVFYYLTKPVSSDILKSILMAASREVDQIKMLKEELKHHKTSFDLINTCKFQFRTLDEAESLSAFMAHCFPDAERVLPGLAEILINAVEHGTYEIGYDAKSDLVDLGTWRAELQRRQGSIEYRERHVEAIITKKPEGVYAVITDMGPGFDWKKYMAIEPSRARDNHGRGIAQARALSFDKLSYNKTGNQAIGFVNMSSQIEW